jgi:hypothetical protein
MSAPRLLVLSLMVATVLAVPCVRAEKITVPGGTRIEARIDQQISSDTAMVGEAFEATVTEPVLLEGALAIPAESALEGRVTVVRPASRSGVIGVRFVRLRTLDGRVYDIDGMLAPTRDGEPVPIAHAKRSAVMLIGDEEEPGKRASTVVGDVHETAAKLADRWSQSGLSSEHAVVAKGAAVTIELRQKLTVEQSVR